MLISNLSLLFREAWDLLLSDSSQKSSNQQQLRASVPVTSPISKLDLHVFPSTSSPSGNRFPSQSAKSAPSGSHFPPLSQPLQTRPASGNGSESSSQSKSLVTPSPQSTQEDQDETRTLKRPRKQPKNSQLNSVAERQVSGQDSSPDITRLLQSLRRDVDALQCSGYEQMPFKRMLSSPRQNPASP